MWKIESLAQYNQLIDRAEQQGFALTNCFFLPAAVQKKVEDGTLYGLEVGSGLLLLDDNGGFYRCYYYLSPQGKPDSLQRRDGGAATAAGLPDRPDGVSPGTGERHDERRADGAYRPWPGARTLQWGAVP